MTMLLFLKRSPRLSVLLLISILVFPFSAFASTPIDSEIKPHSEWYAFASYFEAYPVEPSQHFVSQVAKMIEEEQLPSGASFNYYLVRHITAVKLVESEEELQAYQTAISNISNKSDIGAYLYQGTNYANPHAATSVGGATYAYDDNGNLTSDSTWTHGWNYDNTLKQSVNGGTTVTYEYDHSGQRVKLVSGGTTTRYPNKFYNTDGTKNVKHIYAGDMVVATIENTTLQYVHTDHLTGSNVATNSSGSMIQLLDYQPYGSTRIDWKSGTFDEQRKFTGHEFDRDTSLNYMGARYYNPANGRFLSQDPEFWIVNAQYLVDPQQWNSYSYARNNPLGYIDPDGKKVYAVAKAIEANSFGTHVFMLIVPDNPGDFGVKSGEGWTLGGYAGDEGNLIKARNAPSDVSVVQYGYSVPDQKLGKMKGKVEVGAPANTSDTQFIKNIIAQYDSYADDAAYDAFVGNGYNSNNLVTSILKNSGVSKLPWSGNAPGIDPGYGQAIPNNYTKADGKGRSQGLSAVSGYASRETGNRISNVVQGIGNGIKDSATKAWNLVKGK